VSTVRQLVLSPGAYADTDWLDPAITPPSNARRFKVLGDLKFALRGRATTAPDAALASLGVMTVDAYVLVELPGGGSARGKTVVEVELVPLASQIILVSSVIPGRISRLHLTLATVSAPVIEVLLLEGGRLL